MRTLLRKVDTDILEIIRGVSIALPLRIVGALLSLIVSLVISKSFGASGAGVYFLSLTIITLLVAISRFGLDNVLLKHCAACEVVSDYLDMEKKTLCILLAGGGFSLVITLIAFFCKKKVGIFYNSVEGFDSFFGIMLLSIIPMTFFNLLTGYFRGRKQISIAGFLFSMSSPFFLLCVIFPIMHSFGINGVAVAHLLASFVTMGLGWFFWKMVQVEKEVNIKVDLSWFKELIVESFPFFIITVINLILAWLPIMILGLFSDSVGVGVYGIAQRLSSLNLFILTSINSIVGPKFATYTKVNDCQGINDTLKLSVKIAVSLALPFLIIFTIFPEQTLEVFGNEFISGSNTLRLLEIGEFVNVSTGSVGMLLMMTSNENSLRKIVSIFLIIGGVLNTILIWQFGIVGAGLATMLTTIGVNVTSYLVVRHKLKNVLLIPAIAAR